MAKFNYGKYFGEITPLANALRESESVFWEPASQEGRREGRVGNSRPPDYALYLGCNVLRTVNLAETVVAVLNKLGVDFVPLGGFSHCCGIVHHMNGDEAVSEKIAANSMGKLNAAASKGVLVYCPSCQMHMDRMQAEKFGLDLPYRHVTGFLAERLEALELTHPVPLKVGLHYHPFNPQQEADTEAVLKLLRAIPELEVEAFPVTGEWGRHCAPSTIEAVGKERYREMIGEIFAGFQAAGCDAVSTVYHSCYRELCGFEAQHPVECLNYIELVARGMGLTPSEPKYKRWKKEGDPDAAYSELLPVCERRGDNPQRLRAAVEGQFARPVNITSLVE